MFILAQFFFELLVFFSLNKMSLKVYVDMVSQPSRAVLAFLKANNIPFETKVVQIINSENFSNEFKQISRFGLVPAIDDAGFKLTESVAILRYLCREKNAADHWYPKDSKQQARVDEYLEWQHLNTRQHLMMFVQMKYLWPLLQRGTFSPEEIAKQQKLMENTLDKLETHWLASGPYLVGNKISIADLLAACELEQPYIAGFDTCQGRPRIAEWMSTVRQDLHPHYEEVHKIVRLIADKYNMKVCPQQYKKILICALIFYHN